jgi:hypothetical protein
MPCCARLTDVSQKLGKLLAEFEFGKQSVKLTLFGITKACGELSLERLILILCWISYAVGYFDKDARFVDGCQVSCRIGLRPSRFCEYEIEFPLVGTIDQGRFSKMARALGVPTPCGGVMLQHVLRRACLVRLSDGRLPGCWPWIWKADYPLHLIHSRSYLWG